VTVWLVVIAGAAATYLVRISMVVVFHGRAVPASIERSLALALPAVLAAVAANGLFVHGDAVVVPPPSVWPAVGMAALVARRTHRPVHALLVGLPLVWLGTTLFGG
jgi:branched-subunit amino acid transport protein